MKWLGIGPGRCGTQSLAKIFGADHEAHRFPWTNTLSTMRAADVAMAASQPLVGWTYLSHAHYMRTMWPDLPIVNMWRDKNDCIESHLRVCDGYDRISTEGRAHLKPLGFNAAYPHNPNVPRGEQAWALWYDTAAHIMNSFQGVYDMWMDDLNDPAKLVRLREWLEERGVKFPKGYTHAPMRVDKHSMMVEEE